MGKIQDMANAGEIVILAFRNNQGSGHVAFAAPKLQTFRLESKGPKNATDTVNIRDPDRENNPGTNVPATHLPILVQAGSRSGVVDMGQGVGRWTAEKVTHLNNAVRFYRIRVE
jgi:hypothetical protein